MIGLGFGKARAADIAVRNADAGQTQSAGDLRFLRGVADNIRILRLKAALGHKGGEALRFCRAVQNCRAITIMGGDVREILFNSQAREVRLYLIGHVIAQDHACHALIFQPLQQAACALAGAGVGGSGFIITLEDGVGLIFTGKDVIHAQVKLLVKMQDREGEDIAVCGKANRICAVKFKACIAGLPARPCVGEQRSVPVKDDEFVIHAWMLNHRDAEAQECFICPALRALRVLRLVVLEPQARFVRAHLAAGFVYFQSLDR